MVGRDQQSSAQGLFQIADQFLNLRRRLKIDPVENEPARVQLLEMTDNLRRDPGAGNPDDQPLAH